MPVDYPAQQRLIAALCAPDRYPHAVRRVRLMETHISWVLLAGRYAYKIKKAVDLGFLDFTDRDARRFYCEEEIRLGRRLAPQLYLDVVAIGGSPEQPELAGGPAIEYAVRMRRFPSAMLMDSLLSRGLVMPSHIDNLAATIARFHFSLSPAAPDSAFGTPGAIGGFAAENFDQLLPLLNAADAKTLAGLRQASEAEYSACAILFEQRRHAGLVRECHGDLHLGNIVFIRDEPVPFDSIEFNAGLRWIDVMNEAAFPVMDLLYRSRPDLAFRFLNRYLEATGDYPGVGVLRFYLAYRAMVRAKIGAIRAGQPDTRPHQARLAMTACRRHLALAGACLTRRRPILIITHGLPGCGKTTVSQAVLEQLQAIRIRSDVERKRLFGMASPENSRTPAGDGIYTVEATRQTYAQLLALARGLLGTGFPVIVDAAFLRQAEREQFRRLASETAVPFVILSVKAKESVLRQRIVQRQSSGSDASEADLGVLDKLLAIHEPLLAHELDCAVEFVNEGNIDGIASKVFLMMKAWRN